MDLERMAARARALLGALSLLGLIVFAAGATVFAINVSSTHPPRPELTGAAMISGTLGLVAFVLTLALRPVIEIMVRRAMDQRAQYDQMIGAAEQHTALLEQIRETTS